MSVKFACANNTSYHSDRSVYYLRMPYVRTAVYQLIGCTTYRTRRGLSFTNLNSCLTITACSIIFVMSSCSARAYYYTLLIASEAIQGPEALAHEEQK